MTTSERKNVKRLKALLALKESDPKRYDLERERLLRAWTAEVWRRVRTRDLPPAGELIRTATLFGLGSEVACEVIKAVECCLGGPAFISRSVTLPRGARPDTLAAWCERFAARHAAGDSESDSQSCH